MEITIRPVTDRDASAIARIIRRLGWFEGLSDLSQADHTSQIAKAIGVLRKNTDQTVLVADVETAGVVGYACTHWRGSFIFPQGEGYLSELFVESRFRGQGIGGRLLGRVIREARRRGCGRLVVTHNRHRESYQRGFYRSRDWQERSEMAQLVFPLWSLSDNARCTGVVS